MRTCLEIKVGAIYIDINEEENTITRKCKNFIYYTRQGKDYRYPLEEFLSDFRLKPPISFTQGDRRINNHFLKIVTGGCYIGDEGEEIIIKKVDDDFVYYQRQGLSIKHLMSNFKEKFKLKEYNDENSNKDYRPKDINRLVIKYKKYEQRNGHVDKLNSLSKLWEDSEKTIDQCIQELSIIATKAIDRVREERVTGVDDEGKGLNTVYKITGMNPVRLNRFVKGKNVEFMPTKSELWLINWLIENNLKDFKEENRISYK